MTKDINFSASEIRCFGKFANEIQILACENDIVYIQTYYGIFSLSKEKAMELISLYNDRVHLYKYREPLLIKNNGIKIYGSSFEKVDLLGKAKWVLERMSDHDFTDALEPHKLNPSAGIKEAEYAVSSKDFSITHLYKGEVISYIKLLLGKNLGYSICDIETSNGDKGGILAAESDRGKAYVLSLTNTKGINIQ